MKSIILGAGGSARHKLMQGRPASALPLLSLACFVLLMSACENREAEKEINGLKSRANQIEKQLAPLKALEQRLVALEGQADRMDRSLSEVREQNKILEGHVARLVHAAEQGRRKPIAPAPSPAEKDKVVPGNAPSGPAMHLHTVQPGETLYSIAKSHGMSVEELCRLNSLSRESPIVFGQRLTVMPAKKPAAPGMQLQ